MQKNASNQQPTKRSGNGHGRAKLGIKPLAQQVGALWPCSLFCLRLRGCAPGCLDLAVVLVDCLLFPTEMMGDFHRSELLSPEQSSCNTPSTAVQAALFFAIFAFVCFRFPLSRRISATLITFLV
jgi:hypothetical protein